jgi:hypothetical protein
MKRMLFGFVVLALLLASQSQATAKKKPPPPPDTYVVFNATGTFTTGPLSGTVTIDTTTGQAVWANLLVGGLTVFNGVPSTSTNSAGQVVISGGFYTGIALVIPSASLKGYVGGSLVSGFYGSRLYLEQGIDGLLDGSLEP